MTNGVGISNAAKAVISQCVGPFRVGGQKKDFSTIPDTMTLQIESYFTLAPHGRLLVRVTRYRPRVSCWSPKEPTRDQPNYISCLDALQRMPADTEARTFGRTGGEAIPILPLSFYSLRRSQIACTSHHPVLTQPRIPLIFLVTLLQTYGSNNPQAVQPTCRILVDFPLLNDKWGQSTWFNLWAAGIAINERCMRYGKYGTMTDIDKSQLSPGLQVSIFPRDK